MVKVKTVGKIKGLGEVKECSANFYDQLKALKEAGIKYPISVRDTAYMRFHGGPRGGTRTRHAPIYNKNSPIVLAMVSPLVTNLNMCKEAVEAHRNGNYFFTKDSQVYDKYAEFAEKDKSKEPEKRRAIILPSRDKFTIRKGDEVAETLFQNQQAYFDKFNPNGINFYPIDKEHVDSNEGSLVNYLWFNSPDNGSDLYGGNRSLNIDLRAFGVREYAEGVAKNLPYSAKEVNKNLEILNQVISGEIRLSDLETKLGNVANFLKSLKQ